jgi:hypothetical protein
MAARKKNEEETVEVSVADVTEKVLGNVPQNADGSPDHEAEVPVEKATALGGTSLDAIQHNKSMNRAIASKLAGEKVRLGSKEAADHFQYVKHAFNPESIRMVLVRQTEPQEEYPAIFMSQVEYDYDKFYAYVMRNIHKFSPHAIYKVIFKDAAGAHRGVGYLRMPDTQRAPEQPALQQPTMQSALPQNDLLALALYGLQAQQRGFAPQPPPQFANPYAQQPAQPIPPAPAPVAPQVPTMGVAGMSGVVPGVVPQAPVPIPEPQPQTRLDPAFAAIALQNQQQQQQIMQQNELLRQNQLQMAQMQGAFGEIMKRLDGSAVLAAQAPATPAQVPQQPPPQRMPHTPSIPGMTPVYVQGSDGIQVVYVKDTNPQPQQQHAAHPVPPPPPPPSPAAVDPLAPMRQMADMFGLFGQMATQFQSIGKAFQGNQPIVTAPAETATPAEPDPYQTMEVGGPGGFPVLINRETKAPSVGLSLLAGLPQITEFGKTVFAGVRDTLKDLREAEAKEQRQKMMQMRANSGGTRELAMGDEETRLPPKQESARVTELAREEVVANGHAKKGASFMPPEDMLS